MKSKKTNVSFDWFFFLLLSIWNASATQYSVTVLFSIAKIVFTGIIAN